MKKNDSKTNLILFSFKQIHRLYNAVSYLNFNLAVVLSFLITN